MGWPAGPPVPPLRKPLRILAVSDEESKFIWEHFDPELFRGVDLILSCGDLKASYLSYLVTMIPAPLFYVYGNHDGNYARNPPLGCQSIDGRVVASTKVWASSAPYSRIDFRHTGGVNVLHLDAHVAYRPASRFPTNYYGPFWLPNPTQEDK